MSLFIHQPAGGFSYTDYQTGDRHYQEGEEAGTWAFQFPRGPAAPCWRRLRVKTQVVRLETPSLLSLGRAGQCVGLGATKLCGLVSLKPQGPGGTEPVITAIAATDQVHKSAAESHSHERRSKELHHHSQFRNPDTSGTISPFRFCLTDPGGTGSYIP